MNEDEWPYACVKEYDMTKGILPIIIYITILKSCNFYFYIKEGEICMP